MEKCMKKACWSVLLAIVFCVSAYAGDGTEGNPYTIAEARALSAGATEYWAQGYIVGGRYDDFETPCQYDYAVSCADSASETDFANCLQVLLGKDGGRTTWGLASNPGNVGKMIKFKGFRDSYGGAGNPSFEGVDNADISEVLQENQPPILASIGNKSVVWSNTLSFNVTASDPVDGDQIVLSASGLPAGATFATVTNAGGITNTFSWPNAGPMGVYTTTFSAVDNDGTSSETITITVGDGSGPSYIAFQGFEGTGADTWSITAGAGSIQNLPGSIDTPVNERIRTGSYSWQPGDTDEVEVALELGTVDVSAWSDVMIELHMSATCTNFSDGYGMYPSDSVTFSVALDGGAYSAALTVSGNTETGDGIEGVLWAMDAAGIATATAGVFRSMAPTVGGIDPNGLATVRIHIPEGTTSVNLKATVAQEYYGYYWNIDDISLNGVNDGGAADLPPSIAISPSGTNKTVAVSNALSFVLSATEVPNDSGDTVRLWATGLPSGATFPEVSGTSILTNTFSWTPSATGTTVVSFFAGDKDGTNQVSVRINVYEQQPVGTYRAVICGISDYDGTINDLTYCDDDAQDLYDLLLTGSNWEAGNMQLLLNSQATEANIQAAIAAMGAAAQPGDVCLFFFSGHGGDDMPDTDGDEGGDGYDEYMCPYYIMDNEITDDELGDWLDALPTDNIIVLLDTCHSGGHIKAPAGLTPKGISRTGVVVTDRSNGFVDDLRKRGIKDSNDLTSPYIQTAADDDEYSYEDPAYEHGIYTYFLLEALTNSDANADGWMAGEETFDYLYPKVVNAESTQHPQEYDGWNGLANILTWEPVADQPPQITLDPAGTNKTVVFDTALSFTVTATDGDGLQVSLGASGLPSGATFAGATNTGTASATFNWTPGEAQVGTYNVMFSATDDDGTTERGVKITVRDGSTAVDLFISEYIEGSSNNKAIEIFNGTGSSVDLGSAGYALRIYSNGSTTPTAITLSGTVADGDVFVVANSSAGAAILAAADMTSGSLGFNGNDAVALAKNDANIDVVGTIGNDAIFAENVTKVRKSSVIEGVTTYDPSEWDDYASDTTSYLGSHTFDGGGSGGSTDLLPPVIQAASGVQAEQFNANWQASSNATGYRLDVATNESFSTGGGGGNLMSNAGFETGDSTDWDVFESGYSVVTTSPQEGTYAVECVASSTRDIRQVVEITGDGVTEYEISYWYRVTAGDGSDVRIWASWAAGGVVSGDSLQPASYNATEADWTKMTYNVVPQSGASTLNYEVRTYSGATVYLDNFFVGVAGGGGGGESSFVPGYQNRDVGNVTTYAVTGLTEGVTYYYRVRAYNATSNSVNSGVTNVTTESSTTPEITGFSVPAGATATVTLTTTINGETYALEYTTDPTATPVVWTEADSDVGDGGQLILTDASPSDVMRIYRVVLQ